MVIIEDDTPHVLPARLSDQSSSSSHDDMGFAVETPPPPPWDHGLPERYSKLKSLVYNLLLYMCLLIVVLSVCLF